MIHKELFQLQVCSHRCSSYQRLAERSGVSWDFGFRWVLL